MLLNESDKNVQSLRDLLLKKTKPPVTASEQFLDRLFNIVISSRGVESEIALQVSDMFMEISASSELKGNACLVADAILAWYVAYPRQFPVVLKTMCVDMPAGYMSGCGHGVAIALFETHEGYPSSKELFLELYGGRVYSVLCESTISTEGLAKLSRAIERFMSSIWDAKSLASRTNRVQIKILLRRYLAHLTFHEIEDENNCLKRIAHELAGRFFLSANTFQRLEMISITHEDLEEANEIYQWTRDFETRLVR
jgi:hypothetical protein